MTQTVLFNVLKDFLMMFFLKTPQAAFQHCLSELLRPKFRNVANDRIEAQLAGIMSPGRRKQRQGKTRFPLEGVLRETKWKHRGKRWRQV